MSHSNKYKVSLPENKEEEFVRIIVLFQLKLKVFFYIKTNSLKNFILPVCFFIFVQIEVLFQELN